MSFRTRFLFSVLAASLPIEATAGFASLVYNETTNNMGYSWKAPSQEEANELAMDNCLSRAKRVGECVVVIETQQCFSVFRHKGKDRWAVGATRREAKRLARSACQESFGAKCWRVTDRCAD